MVTMAFRWSGFVLIAGAVLLGAAIVAVALNVAGDRPLASPLISVPLLLSSILLLLSLPAMYAKQAGTASWLGLVGHGLLQAGMLLITISAADPLRYGANTPTGGDNAVDGLLGLALLFGLLLTAIATIRAGVFPRGAGMLLLAAGAGFFFVFFIAELLPPIAGQVSTALLGILLAIPFAWIGASMLHVERAQGAPAAAGATSFPSPLR